MAGSKSGARKAHETKIKKYGEDFYREIGKQSWKNERDHAVGFALLTPAERKELGAKGGRKTKEEYKEKESVHEDDGLATGTGE